MAKAYSYLRFSTPEQEKGDSRRRQTAAAVEYATRKGLELDDKLTFNDLGVSAYRGKNAETGALGLFLEAVRSGLVEKGSTLLVESLDRISRQAARKALRVLEAIVEEGVTVVTLSDGRAYTADNLDEDPMSLMIALLTFIRANEESAMKSKRLKSAWGQKRETLSTEPMTANGPAWLELVNGRWMVHTPRARIIKDIFKAYLQGTGVESIAHDLNASKTPPFTRRNGRDAKMWHRSYILRLLGNPAVIGRFTPHIIQHRADGVRDRVPVPEKAIEGYFPCIIDEATWAATQLMLESGAQFHRGKKAFEISNLFAGLAVCTKCGSAMVRTTKGKSPIDGSHYEYMVCSKAKAGAGCRYVLANYKALEQAFFENIAHVLSEVPSAAGGESVDQDIANAENGLEAISEELLGLTEGYQKTRSESLLERIQAAEEERRGLRESLVALREQSGASTGPLVAKRVETLQEALEKVPVVKAEVNAAIRQVFSGVAVDVDRSVLGLAWRHCPEVSEVVFGWPKGAQRRKRAL